MFFYRKKTISMFLLEKAHAHTYIIFVFKLEIVVFKEEDPTLQQAHAHTLTRLTQLHTNKLALEKKQYLVQ